MDDLRVLRVGDVALLAGVVGGVDQQRVHAEGGQVPDTQQRSGDACQRTFAKFHGLYSNNFHVCLANHICARLYIVLVLSR